MDPELLRTCQQGDVEKLFDTRSHDHEFFLAQENEEKKNILHILFSPGKHKCAEEARSRLPIQVIRRLACQADIYGDNPLHLAASCGFLGVVKLLVDACMDLPSPPWIAKNNRGKLPVQVAVARCHDEVAEFLLSVDRDFLHNVDNAGPLLLDSVTNSCERTGVRLLERHPEELFKSRDSSHKMEILSRAIENNVDDIIKTILNIDSSISYNLRNQDDQNPLHIAVKFDRPKIAQILVDSFNENLKPQVEGDKESAAQWLNSSPLIQKEHVPAAASLLSFEPPWRQTDKHGITPLHLAVWYGAGDFAKYLSASDFAFLSCLADFRSRLNDVYLETFLQFIRHNREDATKQLIKQHPELVQFKDNNGRAILQYALDENDVNTMKLIFEVEPSSINIQDNKQEHLLIKACKKGDLSAIQAICWFCPEVDARGENQTTPLHHVKLQSREEYQELLKINAIVRHKDNTDAHGKSPLIKAIEDSELHLAGTLLEIGVDVMNGQSRDGKTAVVLLKDNSKEDDRWK